MLNEIVCKPGLPKSVKASISQVVRSARNPALDETRSTIAAARRAEPGGTRPLPLRCSEEGKKKDQVHLDAGCPRSAYTRRRGPEAGRSSAGACARGARSCRGPDLSPLFSIIIQGPSGPFRRLINDYKVLHSTSRLLAFHIKSDSDALGLCPPDPDRSLRLSARGP